MIDVTIPGRPQPKERPRFGKGVVRSGARTSAWEKGAALILRNAAPPGPLTEPCRVVVDAYWLRPKRRPKHAWLPEWKLGVALYRPSIPDADNVLKAVLDAGNLAGIWTDDAIVVEATVRKWYAAKGEDARVRVFVEPVR